MAKTIAQLDTELTTIIDDAPNVRAQIKVASKVESEFFAKTYLWWREASQQQGYLDSRYTAKHINYQPRKTGVSWIPLLKLVTDGNITEGDLTHWQAALDAIDADMNSRPNHYASDPVQNIVYFVKSKGGKTSFAGYHAKSKKKSQFDAAPPPSAAMLLDLAEHECFPAFLAEAKAYYTNSTAYALPKSASVSISHNGFGLLAARQGKHGMEAVELGNSIPIVEQVLVMAYRANFDVLPATMRSVIEPLHILNVPHAVASSFDDFVEATRLQDHQGSNRQGKPQKRFIYRPESQDFLLSYGQMEASVVVIAKPNTNVIERVSGDLFLPAYVRSMVETRLLYQRMFNLFTTSAEAKFNMTPDDELRQCIVRLRPKKAMIDIIAQHGIREETISAHVASVRHPPLSFMPFIYDWHKDVWQAGFNSEAFQAGWRGSVSVEWLRKVTAEFFERWIIAYGNKSNRDMNKIMMVSLSGQAMTLDYEFGSNEMWGASKVLPFAGNAAQGEAQITVRSADFAFVMRQIADLNISGAIDVEASDDALVISFASTGLSYRVHIPSANSQGERSTKCFQRYVPINSAPLTNENESDDIDVQCE